MRKPFRIIFAAIPSIAFFVTAAALSYTLHESNQTIDTLRAMIAVQGEEPDVPVFKPVPVDHHYERAGYKILLSDDTYGEIWIPVLADVPLSTHPLDLLKEQEDGRMISYNDKGQVNALTGIDISEHNEVTDWNKVKADGIDFVMLRVGVRKYGSGNLQKDRKFEEYYYAAKDAGLKVGAYFFSQAVNEDEAVEEALLTEEVLYGLTLDFPVVYDWEIIYDEGETARTDNVPCDVLTDCTIAFCENIKAAGYQPMIYQNKRTSLFKLDLPRLQDYPFWLAEYRPDPSFVYDYDMWQYSATGSVDGIKGEVDLDLSFYDYSLPGAPAIAAGEPADGTSPADTTDTTDVTDGTGDTTGDTTAADTTTAAETAEDPAPAAP